MMTQVREYATLTTCELTSPSLDRGVVSEKTFNWLLELQQEWKGKAQLLTIENKSLLKLCNYVGFVEAPNGESVEILPKTEYSTDVDLGTLRLTLQKMLGASIGVKHREANEASLLSMKQPLHEWILSQFLKELTELVRRGLRFDYHEKEDECAYLRGQLNLSRQLRQTPDKVCRFHVRYSEYTPERIENKLIRTALDYVLKQTKNNQNWRIANTLSHQLVDIEPLKDPMQSIDKWEDGKYLVSYRPIKPWCQLILEKLNPSFQHGKRRGIALLFPMEQLFENYLGQCLKAQLLPDFALKEQAAKHKLLTHQPLGTLKKQRWFSLMPDYVITKIDYCAVLDAKWKLLDETLATTQFKYNISQSDLYQVIAYGLKYMDGEGNIMLIYPRHAGFTKPLPKFDFDIKLRVWCVPFDIHTGKLIEGDWCNYFECLALGNVSKNCLESS